MRSNLPLLILSAMIVAAPACIAQVRENAPDEQAAKPAQEQSPHLSAFGRVMAVMIDALQQDAHSGTAPPAGTTAIGTPLGIEVGEAFRLDAQTPAPKVPRTGTNAPMPLAVQADRID